MAYTAQQLGLTAPAGGFEDGGWYGGHNYDAATQTFGEKNQIWSKSLPSSGQQVSQEVRQQSADAQGVSLQDFDTFLFGANASNLQGNQNVPFSSGANEEYLKGISAQMEAARKALEDSLRKQREENDSRLAELRKKEQETLGKVDELTTPFREDLENTERERLHINKNFEENQKLVDELDKLLTEGNEYIRQQKEVTGLAAIRNPRVQKAMEDVIARVGVIEAVINARNGQIAQAENMIDRTVNAITQDRMDRISYYETVLNLNNRDIVSLDADNKRIAEEQLNILKVDLSRAQATVDFIKEKMVDPQFASLMGEAGVSLNMSVGEINSRLTQAQINREIREQANKIALQGGVAVADPSLVPEDQLVSFTDSRGQVHYYKLPASSGGSGKVSETDYVEALKQDARSGLTLSQIFAIYSGYLDPDQIYQLYNASSIYGPDKGNVSNLAKFGVTQPKSSDSDEDLF